MSLAIRFATSFVAVFVAANILPSSFRYDTLVNLAMFAAVLAILNAVVKPLIVLLTCPIQVLTLGLAVFLVNALLFLVAANIVPGISVNDFGAAFLASLVVTIVSWVISAVIRD